LRGIKCLPEMCPWLWFHLVHWVVLQRAWNLPAADPCKIRRQTLYTAKPETVIIYTKICIKTNNNPTRQSHHFTACFSTNTSLNNLLKISSHRYLIRKIISTHTQRMRLNHNDTVYVEIVYPTIAKMKHSSAVIWQTYCYYTVATVVTEWSNSCCVVHGSIYSTWYGTLASSNIKRDCSHKSSKTINWHRTRDALKPTTSDSSIVVARCSIRPDPNNSINM